MLTPIADGVLVHQSAFCRSNAVVVHGTDGVLLVDPGVTAAELACLADDLDEAARPVVAGFATHPHWDHLLWHARFGAAPRYATARAAVTVRERLPDDAAKARVRSMMPPDIADEVPLDLLGLVTALPEGTGRLGWDGPRVRIIEHRAHAAGHAALLIEDGRVLLAGDMLSDVLIPILDPTSASDPLADYLAGLQLLDDVAADVEVVVPGHGSVGGTTELTARIARDRAYLHALRDGRDPDDPRIGPSAEPGWEWVAAIHERQAQLVAHGTG